MRSSLFRPTPLARRSTKKSRSFFVEDLNLLHGVSLAAVGATHDLLQLEQRTGDHLIRSVDQTRANRPVADLPLALFRQTQTLLFQFAQARGGLTPNLFFRFLNLPKLLGRSHVDPLFKQLRTGPS